MKEDLLESWKEIAAYLNRGVRTVQRWEREEGLPVHRHQHNKLGRIYAVRAEIDGWATSRGIPLNSPVSSVSNAQPGNTARAASRSWIPTLSVAVAVCVMIGAAILIRPLIETESSPPLVPSAITTLPGSELFPALSPDGEHVAFSWIRPGKPIDIYVKAVGSEELHRVTNNPSIDMGASWSPDGRWIAFLRGNRAKGPERDLMVVPASGGEERILAKTASEWGPYLTWTPDSEGLIYSRCMPPAPCGLSLIQLESGKIQEITQPPAGKGSDTAPALSTDGRKLLFVRKGSGAIARLHLLALDDQYRPSGAPEALISEHGFATSPVWSGDGKSYYYLAGLPGASMELWQASLAKGVPPRKIAAVGDNFFEGGITVHGNRLITMDLRHDTNIHQLVLSDEIINAESVSLTRSNRLDDAPHISPDGKRVAFHSTRGGGSDIFVMNADGSGLEQLTFFGLKQARMPRWCMDGRRIAFVSGRETGDVYVMNADGGEVKKLTNSDADDALPSWAPDGRTVYFVSDRTGRSEVWKTAVDSPDPVQVTRDGGYRPLVSEDGEFLYYTKTSISAPHGAPLWRRPTHANGPDEKVLDRLVFHPENFEVLGDRIYYATGSSSATLKEIRRFDLRTGQDKIVARIGPEPPRPGFSVSPDGQTLYFSVTDYHNTDLVMFWEDGTAQ